MKRIFLDTNIAIDLLAKRDGFYPAAQKIFSLAEQGKVRIYVSAVTMVNLHYILRRYIGKEKTSNALRTMLSLVKVADVTGSQIQAALFSDFKDFEDAVQYFSAREARAEYIITRNLKDYKLSSIPAILPDAYLRVWGL